MKNPTTTVGLSLTIALLLCLFSFTAVEAQQVVLKADTTYFTLEHQFETGSPNLTGNQKTELHRIFTEKIQERFPDVKDTKQLSFYILGMTNPENWPEACKNKRWGDNDNYPHVITAKSTLEQCANVNEINLGWMRSEMGKSFGMENGWMDPFRVHTGVYGAVDKTTHDGKPTRKTLMIAVIKHNMKELSEMAIIKAINQNNDQQDINIAVLDDRTITLADGVNINTDSIDKLENRVTDLEKDRGIGFSGHIGLSGQYFASQLVPAAEIGFGVGEFEFSGFIGYLPWLTADLDEGPTDYTRIQVGWSATWYALSYEDLRVGPMIGFQWARDDIDAIDCEIVYQSPLAGVAADITLNKRFSLYGNVAYAPTSIHVTGGLEKDVSDVQIRAGIRLNL